MTITQTITVMPDAPQRSDPDNFANDADLFMAAMENLPVELNTFTGQANTLASEVNSNRQLTESAKDIALAAQDTTEWTIGEDCAEGVVRWASDGHTYRSKQGSNQGNDPTTDYTRTWWQKLTGSILNKTGLTGGTSNDLDGVDGAALVDGDFAFVCYGGEFYFYELDATFGATENSPSVISPDSNAGTKRWLLKNSLGSSRAGDFVFLPYEPTSAQMLARNMLEGNGGSLLDADYPNILTAWGGKIYGNVDSTHFNLPPLSGYLPRFFDNGAGIDPDAASRTDRGDGTTGDNVGTPQDDELKSHAHTINAPFTNAGGGTLYGGTGAGLGSPTIAATGGNETRSKNIYIWGGILY